MNMSSKNRFLVAVASITLFFIQSSAMASISVVGAFDSGTVAGSTVTDSISGKSGFGGGILLDHPISMGAAFEIGALYLTRKFDDTSTGQTTTQNMLQVPVMLRFHLLPMISIGLGGYWETGMGNVTTAGDSSGASVTESYSAAGYKQSDLGLAGSVRLHFPLGPGLHFLVDGRYTYGLTNVIVGSSSSVTYRDIQVLAGFTFGFGGGR